MLRGNQPTPQPLLHEQAGETSRGVRHGLDRWMRLRLELSVGLRAACVDADLDDMLVCTDCRQYYGSLTNAPLLPA